MSAHSEKVCTKCEHWIVDPLDPYRYVRLEDNKEVSIKKEEKKKSPKLDLPALVITGIMLLLLVVALL